MPIRVPIEFDFTPRQQRIVRSAVVTGVVLGALGIGVVFAAPPHTLAAGDALRASHLNDNFNDLDARVGVLEAVRTKGASFSSGCNLSSQTGGMTVVNNGAGDCTLVFAPGT